MDIQSLTLAAGLLALTGCAGNVTVPSLGLDHPANPRAAVAPLPTLPTVPKAKKATAGMQGMDHDVESMNHSRHMEGMDMEGMSHE